MQAIIQPGQVPEQPTQPQPQQPEIPQPVPSQPGSPQPAPPQPAQPEVPNEVPDHDIKRTPSRPNDEDDDDTPADEKLGPTKDYNPHGKGRFKDRFPFPNIRH
ncbi:MAG TPA: hypothetical protein VGC22_07700 [Chitinophaga sp.]